MANPFQVDEDGTVHFPAITNLPPSELVSTAFRNAYVDFLNWGFALPSMPAITAGHEEWARFDEMVEDSLAVYLAKTHAHYPVDTLKTTLGGVTVTIVTPKGGLAAANQNRVLINLHGGGFVMFPGSTMGLMESIPLAAIAGIKVITVDYRQAPHARYPAATKDAAAVYLEVLKTYPAEAIGVYGTSAGGTLTGQLLAWLQAEGLPRPGAVGIFWASPDPSFFIPAYAKHNDTSMWMQGVPAMPDLGGMEPAVLEAMAQDVATSNWYMEGSDTADPKAFPLSCDTTLEKFPPTLFVTGTRAFDMSPAISAHARLLKLGVDASLYVMEGGWHGTELMAIGTPEQHDVDNYKAQWFNRHLAR